MAKRKTTHRLTIETAQAIPAPTSPIQATVTAAPPLTGPLPEAMPGNEAWLNSNWRPLMAYQYFTVCLCDFILFPVLLGIYQFWLKQPYAEWHPMTLQGGAIYHFAMGAIVTATSWGRTQEKIAAIKSDATVTPSGTTSVGG